MNEPETWTRVKTYQKEDFDDSWKEEVRQRDEGWQRVERHGTGRLAGGMRGEGGGIQNPKTHATATNTPRNFGKQCTMDVFLADMGP